MTSHVHSDEDIAALQEVETILNETRPKHIGDVILKGIGSIYHGCIGSVGMLVLSPFENASRKSGAKNKVTGFVTGAGKGVLRSVDVAGGGLIQGLSQVFRGVLQTPKAIVAPSKGKWWNDNDGKWVYTDLMEERRWFLVQPAYNEDILGDHIVDNDDDEEEDPNKKKVADLHYYNVLELSASATEDLIERQYHKLARRYSPGRAGAGPKAAEQMKEIGIAYMILTNPEFREGYDQYGMDFVQYGGLCGTFDPSEHSNRVDQPPLIDPYLLYAVLFGSEQLHDWVGTLGAATTAAKQTHSSQPLTKTESRLIQLRRVTSLALSLAERLQEYCDCDDDSKGLAVQKWKMEAEKLVKTSYGNELVNAIGKVYCLCSVQFIGSLENGCGALPSMSAWAKRQYVNLEKGIRKVTHDVTHPAGDLNEMKVQHARDKHKDVDPVVAHELMKKEGIQDTYLRYLWTRTVLDITNTLHETAQMVLFDQSVSAQVRLARAEGLHRLGEVLVEESICHARSEKLQALGFVESCKAPTTSFTNASAVKDDDRAMYEEVAFAAMLETFVRKEQASKRAQNKN